MFRNWYKFLKLFALAALLSVQTGLAGNGKIKGSVKTDQGEALPGANVVVENTLHGAAVDANGDYSILNIPPGTYNVKASIIGYTPKIVTGVIMSSDEIVTLDFVLPGETVGLPEITVQAERRFVDKSQTSTKSTLRSDEIGSLPISDAVGLVATSASAYNGYIRGGKINETKTIVDGVDVSDDYYAAAGLQGNTGVFQVYNSVATPVGSNLSKTVGVNFSSIEEVTVNAGALGSEYASATAGVINYSLREGRGPLSGTINARLSQVNGLSYYGPRVYWNDNIYIGERSALSQKVDSLRVIRSGGGATPTLAADSARLGRYTYTPGKYISEKPQINIEGSLGGIIMEDWGFYFSGKYFDSHGRLPNEHNRELNLTLKSNYNLSNSVKLTAFGIVTDRGKLFGWKNTGYQESARFFLEGVPKNDGADMVGSLKLTHVLSPEAFYELQGSYNYSNNRQGYSDDNGDGFCALNENGDFITLATLAEANKYISNTDLSKFFRNQDEQPSSTNYQFNAGNTTVRLSRPGFYYENQVSKNASIKGDFTDQITKNHQLRAGAQGRFHTYDMVRRSSYLGAVDPKQPFYNEVWKIKPTEFGLYVSDRMEYAGLIVNVGARLDSWNPEAMDFTNYFAPYLTTKAAYDTLSGMPIQVDTRETQRSRKVDPFVFFSPRLGVSHAISDNAAMYFSYARTQIPPPYSRLYAFYNNFGNLSLPNVPTIRQDPYRSSNYEIGAQWQFAEYFGLNFSAYLRDIEDYGTYSYNVIPRNSSYGTNYFITTSAGYADSRGVEVMLRAQPQSVFGIATLVGQLSYAYSYIKAAAFAGLDATMQTSFSTANGDSARLGGDLPFEDLRFYNNVERNVLGANSTLSGGYDRTHRIGYQFILSFPEDIKVSSVGTFQSGFFYTLTTEDPRVSGRELGEGPWNEMVNLRIEKGFSLGTNIRVAVYADIQNLFNWTNILAYDNTTTGQGLWERSNKEEAVDINGVHYVQTPGPDPTGSAKRPVGPDGSFFYDIPREFYFGVRLDF